jgi:sulfopyruvate decarboxylase subunit beta
MTAARPSGRSEAGTVDRLTRPAATRLLAERLTREVVVANLGQATFDLQHLADRPLNCYTYGSMGQCSSIALGIALARPDVRVICLDGDGSLLMNLGSLCTIAAEAPRNYVLVVWDNEVHQTTGGQPTATAGRASLAAIARGAGISRAIEVRTADELRQAYDRILSEDGPQVVCVKIAPGRSEGQLDRDILGSVRRFRNALAALRVGCGGV